MVELANALTFFWLSAWAYYSLQSIAHGDKRSIHFALLVFYIFCGVPLSCDVIFGPPDYYNMPNYFRASRDPTTCFIYCGWMTLVPPICLLFPCAKRAGLRDDRSPIRIHTTWQAILFLIALAPIAFVAFSPDPYAYSDYASFIGINAHHKSASQLDYHQFVAASTRFALIAAATLLLTAPRVTPLHVGVAVIVCLQCVFLHGKRSVIIMCILCMLYVMWYRGWLRGGRLVIASVTAVGVVLLVSVTYQSSVRGIHWSDSDYYYNNIRTDFGRDACIKQAIYGELDPTHQVLEHRCQSMLFYATFFVPRDRWPDKPWPYAVYVTSAMHDRPPRDIGWGVTTSILDEALANLGWIGMLVGPLVLAGFCRLGDTATSPIIRLLTMLLAVLLIVLHATAYLPIVIVWTAMFVWDRYKQGRPRRKSVAAKAIPGRSARRRPTGSLRSVMSS